MGHEDKSVGYDFWLHNPILKIRKNLYILRCFGREAVLFGPRSGAFRPEKRHFFGHKVPFLFEQNAKQLIINALLFCVLQFGKIFTKIGSVQR